MTRSMRLPVYTVVVLSLAMLLLVWFAPLVSSEVLVWPTAQWQWILTFIIALACGLLLWHLLRRTTARTAASHTAGHASESRIFEEDKAQYKQQLMDDWSHLWKILTSRHGSTPYTLAWLMMIGTDGSGKSSWLIDAGFEKVTAGAPNKKSSIVFWLGEHAVIVELAGHYYHRDKEQLDEFLWNHLLELIRQKRPRRPINGILATLSTEQLIMRNPNGLLEQARQLRWRLLALNRQFVNTFPVWILLTQADRLNGFIEMFRRMNSQRQMFPFGFYLQEGYHPDRFREAFDLCHKELSDALFDCIHPEKDRNARQAQVRYFLQFRLLGERLHFFCNEIFQSRYGVSSPELKGVWFSSCGQQGDSLNLLATEVARLHDFKVQPVHPRTPDNQSYFSQQFFNRILFNDMGNVRENPVARKLWLARISLAVGALGVILMTGLTFCWWQIQYNEQLLAQQKMTIRDYQHSLNQLLASSVKGGTPADTIPASEVVQLLAGLQSLNRLYQQSSRWLYHGGLLDWHTAHDVHSFYRQQLWKYLLLPLTRRLHDRLQVSVMEHSDQLFDDLQYYLMLFDPKVRDTGLLQNHIRQVLLADPGEEAGRQLDSLLADIWRLEGSRNMAGMVPDQALTGRAREVLSTRPPEWLVYEHLRRLPQFRGTLNPRELFGSEFSSLFTVDKDGDNAGIPRFYTRNIYTWLNLSATSPLLKQEIISLNRIQKGEPRVSVIELARISRRVRAFYFRDYIRTWDNLLHRIRLQPASSLDQVEQQTIQLARGGVALQALLNVVASETSLAEEPSTPDVATVGQKTSSIPAPAALRKTTAIVKQATRLLPAGSERSIATDNPGIVNQAFAEYTGYGGGADLQSRLSPVLDQLSQELQAINGHFDPDFALYQLAANVMTNHQNILHELWYQSASDDTRAGYWLSQLAAEVWASAMAGAGRYCQQRWQQEVYPYWRQHLSHRFPMSSGSGNDSQLADFTEFFKPKGVLDSFDVMLMPFLQQQSAAGWQLKTVQGQQLPVSRTLLRQLANARQLQQQLFNSDGSFQVKYQVRSLELSAGASELSLRDSHGRFVYRHGPRLWQKRQWPGHESEQLIVTISDDSVVLAQQAYTGPWAWLRFVFDSQQWQKDHRVELLYRRNGYRALLELKMERRGNPFSPALYGRIKLPEIIIRADGVN